MGSNARPRPPQTWARSLPNLLTFLRILAIPIVAWLLTHPGRREAWTAMFVYLAASLTDFLDGWIARRYGFVTAVGKLLDPLADKLLDRGIYVIGFSYPVVPHGQARIRIQLSAAHTPAHLEHALRAFTEVGRELGIIK